MPEILVSLHGPRLGLGYGRHPDLGHGDELITNCPGGQMALGVATHVVSSAEVLALNATAQVIMPAPGASLAIVPRLYAIHKPAGTAYGGVAAGEDLVFKYTDDSGLAISQQIETTGFLDQATAQTRFAVNAGGAGPLTIAPNAAVVLHLLTGEIITGTSPLNVRVWYDLIEATF